MQCQCIVSERSCGLYYIFDLKAYLLVCGPSLKKTGIENLEQLLYLCIFVCFWILITASNCQL